MEQVNGADLYESNPKASLNEDKLSQIQKNSENTKMGESNQ